MNCMARILKFSEELETWLKSEGRKTIRDLEQVFAEKSFAIAIFLLMALPALPIPTGGVSHVFEVIAIIIAFQMIIGLKAIWIPKRWANLEIGSAFKQKALVPLTRFIRFFERFSRPRWTAVTNHHLSLRLIGVIIIVFTAAAFFSPPFSGLDTLPALGVVLICLSIILEDILMTIIGIVVGCLGIALILTVGAAAFKLLNSFL